MIFSVFQIDISGSDVKEEHSWKKHPISFTFLVFHLDISGNDFKFMQFIKYAIHISNIFSIPM